VAASQGCRAPGVEEWMVALPLFSSWVVMWVVKGGRPEGCGELSGAEVGVDMAYDFRFVGRALLACLNY
jgi:hypothetical protein